MSKNKLTQTNTHTHRGVFVYFKGRGLVSDISSDSSSGRPFSFMRCAHLLHAPCVCFHFCFVCSLQFLAKHGPRLTPSKLLKRLIIAWRCHKTAAKHDFCLLEATQLMENDCFAAISRHVDVYQVRKGASFSQAIALFKQRQSFTAILWHR